MQHQSLALVTFDGIMETEAEFYKTTGSSCGKSSLESSTPFGNQESDLGQQRNANPRGYSRSLSHQTQPRKFLDRIRYSFLSMRPHVRGTGTTNESSKDSTPRLYPKAISILRQFRLQILGFLPYLFSFWKSKTEHRKIAIYQSRTMAMLHSFLHLLPLAGAMTLLVLFWSQYWAGAQFGSATLLQFVAKFHELLMQASIADISLHIIRSLALNGYTPLGVLSGISRTTQLSYLWFLDFWASIRARDFYGWRKFIFLSTFPVLLLLAALVGPSAAVLMIPRPNTPHKNWATTMYTDPTTFPSTINEREPLMHGNRLTYDTETFTNLPQVIGWTHIPGANDFAETYNSLVYESLSGAKQSDSGARRLMHIIRSGQPRQTNNMSVPTWYGGLNFTSEWRNRYLMLGDDLGDLDSETDLRHEPTYSVLMPTMLAASSLCAATAPSVCSKLRDQFFESTSAVWSIEMMPQPAVHVTCSIFKYEYIAKNNKVTYNQDNGTEDNLLFDEEELFRRLFGPNTSDLASNKTAPGFQFSTPIWLPSSEPSSLIGVFVSPQNSARNVTITKANVHQEAVVRTCNVQPTWMLVSTSLAFTDNGRHVVQTDLPSQISELIRMRKIQWITLNLANDSPLREAEMHREIAEQKSNAFPMILACILAEALSNIPNILTPSNMEGAMHQNTHEVFKTVYGYRYGNTSVSDILSALVITIYCLIVINYIAYTIYTGYTSTAWNSPVEIIALALGSSRPDHLGHASVGIDSMETLGESVGIRVNQQDEVELVFANDRDLKARGLRKVEYNRAY